MGAEVESLMHAFDSDGNGEIDYKEFCSMLARYGRLTMPSESEKTVDKAIIAEEFPVGCKVKALFNLPRASNAEGKIGTVTGVGKKGMLLVQFKAHDPMVVRATQVKRIDSTGSESLNVKRNDGTGSESVKVKRKDGTGSESLKVKRNDSVRNDGTGSEGLKGKRNDGTGSESLALRAVTRQKSERSLALEQ